MESIINSAKVKDCLFEHTVILLTVYLKVFCLHLLTFKFLHSSSPQLTQQKDHLHYAKTSQTYDLPVLIFLTVVFQLI